MAFLGIGGGVNLGAATGYLFIDGSGMRKGIKSAEQALDDFQSATEKRAAAVANAAARNADILAQTTAKSAEAQRKATDKITQAQADRVKKVSTVIAQEAAKVANLQAKASASATQAAKTAVLNDPAQQTKLTNLANDVAVANQKATQVIADGYVIRQDAELAYQAAVASGSAKEVVARKAVADATAKEVAIQKQLADVQAKIGSGAGTATERRSLGGQKTQLNRKLGLAASDVAAAQTALTKIQNDNIASNAAASVAARNTILKSVADEQLAVNEATLAIQAQAAEYKRLAVIAGSSVETAAAAVEVSANRAITSANALEATNAKLAAQQDVTAGLTDVGQIAQSIEAEKRLSDVRLKNIDANNKANADFLRQSSQLNKQLAATGAADAAQAAADAGRVTAAKIAAVKEVTDANVAAAAKEAQVRTAETAKVVAVDQAGVDARVAGELRGNAEIEASDAKLAAERKGISATAINGLLQKSTFAALGFGAAIGLATKSFAGFDEQMHNVASISDDASGALTTMRDHVLELSKQTGQAPEDLAKALYDIVSSGFDGANALKLLDASSTAAVAGLSDVATSGKSLTAVINAYSTASGKAKLTIDDLGKVSDIAFQAVKDGVFSFTDLSQQQGDNLAISAELGVQYQELASAYVVLTKQGNSLAESTTQINGILRTLIKPNEALAAALDNYGKSVLHVTGLTGSALVEQYGFAKALEFVGTVTHGSAEEIAKLFPNVRALRGELGLGGRNLAAFNVELARMADDGIRAGATSRALTIQQQAFAFKMRQTSQEVRQAAILFGAEVAPAVLQVAQAFGKAAEAFSNLSPDVRSAAGAFTVWGFAATASVVVLAKIVSAIRGVVQGFKVLRTAIIAATSEGAALDLLLGPIGLILIALTAIGLVAFKTIEAHRAHAQAVKALAKTYDELAQSIKNLAASGQATAQLTKSEQDLVDKLKENLKLRNDSRGEISKTASDLFVARNLAMGGSKSTFDFQGNTLTIKEANDLLAQYDALLSEIDHQEKDMKPVFDDLNSLFLSSDLDISKVITALQPVIASFMAGTTSAADLDTAIKNAMADTADFGKNTGETAKALTDMGDALVSLDQFFGTADDQANNFRKGIQGLVTAAETAAGAMDDFSSPLAFIQNRIGGVGDSVATTLLKLEKLALIRPFTKFQEQGLKALSTLDQTQAQIDKVNQSIAESQSVTSSWNTILDTVTNTIGTASTGYALLNQLVADGKLKQQEANDALTAGRFLQEAAVNGIEDEQAAIAKSLPDLAKFVQAHEVAKQKYDKLDPAARGFADSLKDAQNQAIIMTVVMATLAHTLDPDAFPREFNIKFIADLTKASPEIAAMLDELGLIPPEVKADIIITNDPKNVDALKKVRDDLIAELVDLTKPGQVLSDDDVKRAEDIGNQIGKINDLATEVSISVKTDPKDALPKLTADEQAAADQAKATTAAITSAFNDTQSGINDVGGSIAQVLPDLINAASGIDNFSDPLSVLKKHLAGVNDTMASVVLKGAQLGNITLTPAQTSALRLKNDLDGVTRKITRLDAAIAKDQDEMSTWQNRIDLIDNTIGSATDTLSVYQQELDDGTITQKEFNDAVASGDAHTSFAQLNQLLETGRITQAQYNDILTHAIHLRERSVGGVLDERAAIALSIPDLDRFIDRHDKLDGKYKNLSPDQKGFLTALNDQAVQTALLTFEMFSLLEALGQLPKGTAKAFASLTARNNPEVAAVFDQLSVLKEGVDIPISADTKQADSAIDKTKKRAAGGVDLPVTPVTPGGAPTDAAQTLPLIGDQSFTVNADTRKAKRALEHLVTFAQDQISLAYDAGTSFGLTYANGVSQALQASRPMLTAEMLAISVILANETTNAGTYGRITGQQFDEGIVSGVRQLFGNVQNAGIFIARVLYNATLAELQAHSPSRKGMEVAGNYVDGIVLGLHNGQATATAKAASIARSIHGAFAGELAKSGRLDMLGGRAFGTGMFGARPLTPFASGGGTHVHNNQIAVGDINVNGAGDPKAVAQAVNASIWQELDGSLRRLQTQTGQVG
jgi:TP901 family phage tail tape measure protein